jgi:V/A-type H+-transporting ATPase subunit C
MKSKLIPKETYPKLLNMELPEIIRFIEETEYKKDVDELARKFSGMDLVEHALNQNLGATYRKLIDISQGDVRYQITEYMRRWDVWNIKTLLRGKYYGASQEEILDYVVSAGQLRYRDLTNLARLESIPEVVSALEGTPYSDVVKDYTGEEPLTHIEDELDKMYYTRLVDSMGQSQGEKLFLKFIRTEIDIKNLKTLFRLMRSETEREEIQRVLIPGGREISDADLNRLSGMSFSEFIRSLEGYSYWNVISDVVSEDMSSLLDVEQKLDAHLIDYAKRISHYYPLSILPVLDYVLNKKIEVDNLRVITRGKESKLSEDIIKAHLVM